MPAHARCCSSWRVRRPVLRGTARCFLAYSSGLHPQSQVPAAVHCTPSLKPLHTTASIQHPFTSSCKQKSGQLYLSHITAVLARVAPGRATSCRVTAKLCRRGDVADRRLRLRIATPPRFGQKRWQKFQLSFFTRKMNILAQFKKSPIITFSAKAPPRSGRV